MVMDGTDYEIPEPTIEYDMRPVNPKTGRHLPFNPKWCTEKHQGPGLHYETASCMQTGDIVWTKGPFPCGTWSDSKIFQHFLIHKLDQDEMLEAGGTCIGLEMHCRLPHDYFNRADKLAKGKTRARHETSHGRLKNFGILGSVFRHHLSLHKRVHKTCVVLVQLGIDNGENTFHVNY